MGTPDFAVPCLDILIKNNYNVVGVITAPDKPAGRGQQLQKSAVKIYAEEKGLHLLQPVKLKDPDFINELKNLKADLQVVVAFRMLPDVVWEMPPLGTYNLHASLLPKYRGAAPINWAIINGETETGVTTFKLQHQIDTGNILFQQSVPISNTTTAGELHDTLMTIGAELILRSVKAIESGNAKLQPQNETGVIHAPKLFKETCRIQWNNDPTGIYNFVRGLSPYPAANTEFKDKQDRLQLIKIFLCTSLKESHHHTNGLIVTDNKTFIKIACSGGFISIIELQLQGKKKMKVEEFLRGYSFPENCICA